jgi:hypothetical protein
MTTHRNSFLVNKTNRCTEFQFYWYYYSTCFRQLFCPSSGVLSHTSALVHFMQLWPFATRSRMELHPTPGSKRFITTAYVYKPLPPGVYPIAVDKYINIKCTKADVLSRTLAKNSWWWAERLRETCRVVISIKLEFSASVGFIHKECGCMFLAVCVRVCRS